MKRSIKITSALLVLVLLLAQVVCVNAVSYSRPSVSTSVKQTDHYIKTVTVSVSGDNATGVSLQGYDKKDGTAVSGSYQSMAIPEGAKVSCSLEVRPSEVGAVKVRVRYKDSVNTDTVYETWVTVGSNSYYNPSSSGSSNRYDSDDYWDGFRGSSSSSSTRPTSGSTSVPRAPAPPASPAPATPGPATMRIVRTSTTCTPSTAAR